ARLARDEHGAVRPSEPRDELRHGGHRFAGPEDGDDGHDDASARVSVMRRTPGRTNSVRNVEKRMPPMTTVASGLCTSAPAPVASAIGKNPKAATAPVVMTARIVWIAPLSIASSMESPPSMRRFTSFAMTTPFKTETPASAMKPTAAGMLNDRPRKT